MADALKFQFTLLDKMSAPASAAAKAVSNAGAEMKGAKTAADAMTGAVDKAAAAIDKTAAVVDKLTAAHDKLAPAVSKSNAAVNLTIAQHNAVASGLAKFAQGVSESSLTLEQHNKVAEGLSKFFQSLGKLPDKAKPKIKALNFEFGNLYKSFVGFRREASGSWTFNLAEGLESVTGVVQRLGGALYDVTARAVQVGAAAEKTGRAFKLNLGEKAGGDVTKYLRNVSDASRGQYTTAQLAELVQPAIQQKYGLKDIGRLLPISQSLEQRGLSGSGGIGALTAIRSNRQFGSGTLDALGFGGADEKARIAKRLGGAGVNPNAALDMVGTLVGVSARKADKVYAVLLDELQKREGGKLGNEAAAGQNTPAATLARLANVGTILAEKLSNGGKLDGIISALDRFSGVLTSKSFVNSLGAIIDKFAFIVEKVSGYLGETSEGDKIRSKGGLAIEDASGNVRQSFTTQGKYNLAKETLGRTGEKYRSVTDIDPARIDALALAAVRYNDKNAGKGTVLKLPVGAEAIQFGYDQELGRQQADAAAKAGLNGPPVKSADDFISRPGGNIEINPDDTVIGFKRGGSLGVGSGGGGGGMPSVTLSIAEINVNGAGKNAGDIASEVLDRIRDEAPGMLLSALEQFAAETGASKAA